MKKTMDVVFILDKSGSMSGSELDTIGGFNSYLSKTKKEDAYITKITTVIFDSTHHTLHDRVDIKKVKKMTEEDYCVGGCTALYDALGDTIKKMEKVKTDKVLFVITTDGYENASKEFNNEMIKKLIKKHKEWEFIYLGADIDSYAAGSSIGISTRNISNYRKSKEGMNTLFDCVAMKQGFYAEDSDGNWKAKLDEYLEENK